MAINRYIVAQTQNRFQDESYPAFSADSKAHFIDQVSEDISEEHGFVYQQTSAKRAARNRLKGPRMSGGEVGVPMYTVGTPTLMYYALGSLTTTQNVAASGGNPANFKHVIVPANSIPAFQMGVGKDIKEHRFVGCAVKSLKVDYTVSDPALATFDLLIRKELAPGDLQTKTLPDYDIADRTFLGVEVDVYVKTTGSGSWTKVGYVRSLSLSIENDLKDDTFAFGSRFLPVLRIQSLTVTGTLTMALDDIARYTDVLDENSMGMRFVHERGTKTNHDYKAIEIEFPQVSFDSAKVPTDANNEYILDVEFTSEVLASDPNLVKITVYNNEPNARAIA